MKLCKFAWWNLVDIDISCRLSAEWVSNCKKILDCRGRAVQSLVQRRNVDLTVILPGCLLHSPAYARLNGTIFSTVDRSAIAQNCDLKNAHLKSKHFSSSYHNSVVDCKTVISLRTVWFFLQWCLYYLWSIHSIGDQVTDRRLSTQCQQRSKPYSQWCRQSCIQRVCLLGGRHGVVRG